MDGKERKYPDLEMRRALHGKALNMVNWVDREKLKRESGVNLIL